jgi:hypothetical protein
VSFLTLKRRKKMKRHIPVIQIMVVSSLFFAIFHVSGLCALADSLPKAEDILDQYIVATGGGKAYQMIHSRKVEATVTFSRKGFKMKNAGVYERPDKYYSVSEVMTPSGMIPAWEAGSDGKIVWDLAKGTQGSIFEGEEKGDRLISNSIDPLFNWESHFKSVKTLDIEDVDGTPCYKVAMTPFEGTERTYYFEKDSHLVKKVVSSPPKVDPGAEGAMISYVNNNELDEGMLTQKDKDSYYFSDYKTVDGILLPHAIRQVSGEYEILTVVIDNIQNNIEISENQFDLPGRIKWRLETKVKTK